MYCICTKCTLRISKKNLRWWVKTNFKFEFSTLKLGKNGYFCACLNFFLNQCNLLILLEFKKLSACERVDESTSDEKKFSSGKKVSTKVCCFQTFYNNDKCVGGVVLCLSVYCLIMIEKENIGISNLKKDLQWFVFYVDVKNDTFIISYVDINIQVTELELRNWSWTFFYIKTFCWSSKYALKMC